MSHDINDHILNLLERWWSAKHTERHGIVTSYDPKKYIAKVAFQPGGQESGWLPIETGHIGESYGIVTGLQPGQGGVNSQGQGGQVGPQSKNQGDQVIVRFQEGDFESGKIVQRVHSDQDSPPQAQSGEMIFYTKFSKSGGPNPDAATGGQGGTGQQVYFKNDGSISLTDGNGGTLIFDGKGNCTINCKNLTIVANGDKTETVNGASTESVGGDLNKSIGGKRIDNISGIWRATAASGLWKWLMDDDG